VPFLGEEVSKNTTLKNKNEIVLVLTGTRNMIKIIRSCFVEANSCWTKHHQQQQQQTQVKPNKTEK
jgi:hypothetical protein